MKKYLSFFKMRLIAGLQYRVAALAGLSTQVVWGLLEVMLYRAFYKTAPELLPMDMQALASYIWIRQAMFCMWNIYHWEQELFQSVQTGAVAYELVRPTNLYAMWAARSLALRLSRTALRAVPVLLVGCLMPAPYGIRLTISAGAFGLCLVSAVMSFWMYVCVTLICYGLTFYVVDPKGIITFVPGVLEFLAGDFIPLPFFPDTLRRFAELSPSGSMQNVPLRIFGGDIAGASIAPTMLLQLFWCIVLTAVGYLLLNRGLRRTVIAGG